jgi:hypothetical protein
VSEERRAIEALRAGVPNRAAVRLMSATSQAIAQQFDRTLQAASAALSHSSPGAAAPAAWQIVEGEFGSGKTHLLSYLQEQALLQNFVVSRIPISKETPLFDTDKLFVSAMRAAMVPRRNDDAMTAVMASLKPNTERFDLLEQWAIDPKNGLSPLFPALLHLIPRPVATPEVLDQIARFFAGGKLTSTQVKRWLREDGSHKMFALKPIRAADLAIQRLHFVPRLMAAAGYGGWCVLLDEVELIGRYSLLQRGRAYAELARWLGLDAATAVPGLATVAAVTNDFSGAVIITQVDGPLLDDQKVPPELMKRGDREAARLAELGMRALQRRDPLRKLTPPDHDALQDCLAKVRRLYNRSYCWEPPDIEIGDMLASKSMRQYIKSWITEWDLLRLYGVRPAIEIDPLKPDYTENPDITAAIEARDDDESD